MSAACQVFPEFASNCSGGVQCYCIENNTSLRDEEISCREPATDPIGIKLGKTLSICLLMSWALVGNLLVILVFKRNLATRTNTNCFVVNMAVSDLLFPLFLWPKETSQFWSFLEDQSDSSPASSSSFFKTYLQLFWQWNGSLSL